MARYVKLTKVISELNELMSAGYTTSEAPEKTGFSYAIKPLSFNLQQKGKGIPNTQNYFKFYVGNKVSGISPYNDKEYTGIIKHIYYNEDTNKPELVYIQDLKSNSVIPLQIKDLKHVK